MEISQKQEHEIMLILCRQLVEQGLLTQKQYDKLQKKLKKPQLRRY